MTEQSFAAGAVVFRPGDPSDRAYLIRDGQVDLLTGPPDRPVLVARLGTGQVFGEMGLVEERPRSLTARAVTAVRADGLTRDEFEQLLTADPAGARQYLKSLFERLRSLSARLGGETPAEALAPSVPPTLITGGPAELPTDGAARPPSVPEVIIHPLTRKAAETLPDEGLRVTRFPFRFGRAAGAKELDAFDLNDLWLLDQKPYNVSKNHCEIDLDRTGRVIVRDRGSSLGCIVNETRIGGPTPAAYFPLHPGDNVLILGIPTSPYQFRVTVAEAA